MTEDVLHLPVLRDKDVLPSKADKKVCLAPNNCEPMLLKNKVFGYLAVPLIEPSGPQVSLQVIEKCL